MAIRELKIARDNLARILRLYIIKVVMNQSTNPCSESFAEHFSFFFKPGLHFGPL